MARRYLKRDQATVGRQPTRPDLRFLLSSLTSSPTRKGGRDQVSRLNFGRLRSIRL